MKMDGRDTEAEVSTVPLSLLTAVCDFDTCLLVSSVAKMSCSLQTPG